MVAARTVVRVAGARKPDYPRAVQARRRAKWCRDKARGLRVSRVHCRKTFGHRASDRRFRPAPLAEGCWLRTAARTRCITNRCAPSILATVPGWSITESTTLYIRQPGPPTIEAPPLQRRRIAKRHALDRTLDRLLRSLSRTGRGRRRAAQRTKRAKSVQSRRLRPQASKLRPSPTGAPANPTRDQCVSSRPQRIQERHANHASRGDQSGK